MNILILLLTIVFTTNCFARSPAVEPVVEIVIDHGSEKVASPKHFYAFNEGVKRTPSFLSEVPSSQYQALQGFQGESSNSWGDITKMALFIMLLTLPLALRYGLYNWYKKSSSVDEESLQPSNVVKLKDFRTKKSDHDDESKSA